MHAPAPPPGAQVFRWCEQALKRAPVALHSAAASPAARPPLPLAPPLCWSPRPPAEATHPAKEIMSTNRECQKPRATTSGAKSIAGRPGYQLSAPDSRCVLHIVIRYCAPVFTRRGPRSAPEYPRAEYEAAGAAGAAAEAVKLCSSYAVGCRIFTALSAPGALRGMRLNPACGNHLHRAAPVPAVDPVSGAKSCV